MSTNEKSQFLDMTLDIIFKVLWFFGDEVIRKRLEKDLEDFLDCKFKEFDFKPNELNIKNIKSIATRADILFASKDKIYLYNIEMNRLGKENTSKTDIIMQENKSVIYLGSLIANFYEKKDKNRYKRTINILQINLNTYYNPLDNSKEVVYHNYMSEEDNLSGNNVGTVNLYLPRIKDLWYTLGNEKYHFAAFYLSKSYEEMEMLAEKDSGRLAIIKFLRKLGRNGDFMEYLFDYEDYRQAVKEQHEKIWMEIGEKRGKKEGKLEGKKETQIATIKAMHDKDFGVELIASIVGLSKEKVMK